MNDRECWWRETWRDKLRRFLWRWAPRPFKPMGVPISEARIKELLEQLKDHDWESHWKEVAARIWPEGNP